MKVVCRQGIRVVTPDGVHTKGETIEVTDEVGNELVRRGFATLVSEPAEAKPLPANETQAAPTVAPRKRVNSGQFGRRK